MKVQGETASGVKATASYPGDVGKIINEGDYTKSQDFTIGNKIALY